MLGFFKWFKPGTRMKRWLFVILVGIVLLCLGIATIIDMKELSILEIFGTVLMSIIGFILVIVGIVYSQKRVLELLVEETDDRISKDSNNKDINVKSLIFNKTIYKEGPKIVVIGGGSGLNAVLKGLKEYTNNITAIVAMSEYGNNSTSSLPIEDIKQSIIALADNEEEMSKILNLEIQDDTNFTDVFIASMKEVNSNDSKFIENISEVLKITGKILPVTLDKMNICAELDDRNFD